MTNHMPLLCIGGCLDGKWRMSDQPGWRVQVPMPICTEKEFDMAIVAQTFIAHTYVREGFSFSDRGSLQRMEFWRHDKLSLAECIAMLFARYQPEAKL